MVNISNPNTRLPEKAYDHIVRLLESDELQPGDPVSVRMLAGRLDMSTLSITNALHLLENDGLIVSRNRSGSNVAVVTSQDVWNMVQYRVALETRGARIACQLASDAELANLQKLAQPADGIGVDGDDEWLDCDDAFHQGLMHCSHTPSLFFPPHYLRIFHLKLELCPGLKLFPDFKDDGHPMVAQGHRLMAELATLRDMEQLSTLLEIHICNAIGLPQLASLRENAKERIAEISDFLDRNKRK